MSSERKVTLLSTDGETFEVGESVLRHEIQTVPTWIQLAGIESPIPIPKASGVVMEYILGYCKYYSQQSSSGMTNPVLKGRNRALDESRRCHARRHPGGKLSNTVPANLLIHISISPTHPSCMSLFNAWMGASELSLLSWMSIAVRSLVCSQHLWAISLGNSGRDWHP